MATTDLDHAGGDGPDSGVTNGRTTRDVELLGDDDEARPESGTLAEEREASDQVRRERIEVEGDAGDD